MGVDNTNVVLYDCIHSKVYGSNKGSKMYNVITGEHEIHMSEADWAAMSTFTPVVNNITRVSFKTWEQLKKMNREALDNLHMRLFGAYNPYGDRYAVMSLINNAMTKEIVKFLEALTGFASPIMSEDAFQMERAFGKWAMELLTASVEENVEVTVEYTEGEGTELDQLFNTPGTKTHTVKRIRQLTPMEYSELQRSKDTGRITEYMVATIRRLFAIGHSQSEIAQWFDLFRAEVHRIVKYKIFTDVAPAPVY